METLTQILLAISVAVLGIQLYKFNLRDTTLEKLEEYKSLLEDKSIKLLLDVIQLEQKVNLLERKHNQKASILKFVINDMNDRLRMLSKGLQELKVAEYECYHWTLLDLDNIHWNYSEAVEEQQCEYYSENVYTKGNNEDYPGCESCWCCKELDNSVPTETSEPHH